jgi:hypothetical protein
MMMIIVFSLGGIAVVAAGPAHFANWGFGIFLVGLGTIQGRMPWRSCRLEDGRLLAQGRFASRKVDLRDLRQAGAGPMGGVWIQTHHPLAKRGGTSLCLPMISTSKQSALGMPGGSNAAELIRERAEAAGAELDPPLGKPKMVPKGKGLMFGA